MSPTLPPMDKNVNHAPHVFILGAGASIAAYHHWGSTGPPLPSMEDLIDVLSLRKSLEAKGHEVDGLNFEALYDDLVSSGSDPELQNEIEGRVGEYFGALTLPDSPTLYDYLVLGLREKDLVATFNWDPFLLQAYQRNAVVAPKRRPRIVFLHGNVRIGACHKDKVSGLNGSRCSKCGELFTPSRLLYPVKHKDYSADPYIESEWSVLRNGLERAFYLTVFGYSAPETDVEARELMLGKWKTNKSLELAEVDIVDVKPRDEVKSNWEEFFYSHHYSIYDSITNNYIWRHPRRTCDAFASAILMCDPWPVNPYPEFKDLKDLQSWVKPLIAEEEAYDREKKPFSERPPT